MIAPAETPFVPSRVEKKSLGFLRKIQRLESIHKIYPPTKEPHFHLAKALEAWVKGAAFRDLGRYTDVDEGEIIRYFRMVIQLLRQLKHAPQVAERLRQTAGNALQKINRDLVDAEKQLRNM